MAIRTSWPGVSALPMQVVYSEFLDLVNTGNVHQARIDESLQKVYFSVRPLQQADQQDEAAIASTSGKVPPYRRLQGLSMMSSF